MRLWHKDLIKVLPRKQLLAQWRECCAIISNINIKGTPNHILVNPIIEYDSVHFIEYCNRVISEMGDRGYKINKSSYLRFTKNLQEAVDKGRFSIHNPIMYLYKDWMNDKYLRQCYYNLEEKYDRGMITKEEWTKIFYAVDIDTID